tara:strand:+ start:645 stop:1334 length:690 start_codon:yes stop_codon:yes gene_type:complete
MKISQNPQNTIEWHLDRAGMITASDFCVLTKQPKTIKDKKNGVLTDLQKKYVIAKANDRLLLDAKKYIVPDQLDNPDIRRGNDHEKYARTFYSARKEHLVSEIGFCTSDDCESFGCSPDGIFNYKNHFAILEIKCPRVTGHYNTIKSQTIPNDYLLQIHAQLTVTDAVFCDYVSFCLDAQDGHELYIQRVWNDKQINKDVLDRVHKFNDLIEKEIKEIKKIDADQLWNT